ncbi:MAG: GDSL-type esterase/lipase family protein [Pseudomonadota bacterium]
MRSYSDAARRGLRSFVLRGTTINSNLNSDRRQASGSRSRSRKTRYTLALLAAAVLVVSAGCTVWRVNDAKALAKASEPFQAEPAGATASILIIGDSTAVGTGASAPPRSIAGLIAQSRPGLRVVNRATDGARYADFAAQLQQDTQKFDTVLVLGGGNDVIRLTSEGELRQSVDTVAELAARRGKRVILMPPGNVGNAPFFFVPASWLMTRRSQTLHGLVRDAATRTGATYVNLYKPKALDPFAQRPGELHASDGLHPSDAGYREWMSELNRQAQLDTTLAALR